MHRAVAARARPRSAVLRSRARRAALRLCVDFMPSHPNGRIKPKPPSAQPQVGFVDEVQTKQS